MRCRPGDMAIVTSPPPQMAAMRGRIVRVLHLVPTNVGTYAWRVDRPVNFVLVGNIVDGVNNRRYAGQSVYLTELADHWLTPLRGDLSGDDTAQGIPEKPAEQTHA